MFHYRGDSGICFLHCNRTLFAMFYCYQPCIDQKAFTPNVICFIVHLVTCQAEAMALKMFSVLTKLLLKGTVPDFFL